MWKNTCGVLWGLQNVDWMSTTQQLNIMFTQLSTQPKTNTTYKYRGHSRGLKFHCLWPGFVLEIQTWRMDEDQCNKNICIFVFQDSFRLYIENGLQRTPRSVERSDMAARETPRFGAQLETQVVTVIKVHSCKDRIQFNKIRCSHLNMPQCSTMIPIPWENIRLRSYHCKWLANDELMFCYARKDAQRIDYILRPCSNMVDKNWAIAGVMVTHGSIKTLVPERRVPCSK